MAVCHAKVWKYIFVKLTNLLHKYSGGYPMRVINLESKDLRSSITEVTLPVMTCGKKKLTENGSHDE